MNSEKKMIQNSHYVNAKETRNLLYKYIEDKIGWINKNEKHVLLEIQPNISKRKWNENLAIHSFKNEAIEHNFSGTYCKKWNSLSLYDQKRKK